MKLSLLLSGGLGEVLLYSLHALHLHFRSRLADAMFKGDSLVKHRWGGGDAVSLKDLLTVEKELMGSRW